MDERIINLLEDISGKLDDSNSLKELILDKLGTIEYEIENLKGVGTFNQISDVYNKLDEIETAIESLDFDASASSIY